MNSPTVRFAEHLQDWSEQAYIKDEWVLARPLGFQGIDIIWRLKCAWLVFTGKCDVLAWKQDFKQDNR